MCLKFVVRALGALLLRANCEAAVDGEGGSGFVGTKGIRFVANGKPLYLNRFNAYWMMYLASDLSTRDKVTSTFQEAVKNGMNIARTLAFSDGVDRALQITPGVYNEEMFKVKLVDTFTGGIHKTNSKHLTEISVINILS